MSQLPEDSLACDSCEPTDSIWGACYDCGNECSTECCDSCIDSSQRTKLVQGLCCLLPLFLVGSALFFGIFFGIKLDDEVKYVSIMQPSQSCTFQAADITQAYCCSTACGCMADTLSLPSCAVARYNNENLADPVQCAAGNTAKCPTNLQCTDEGSCCSRTCRNLGPLSTFNRTTLTKNDCLDCRCCTNSISATPLRCDMACPICYTVKRDFDIKLYRTNQMKRITETKVFRADSISAYIYSTQYAPAQTLECWYNKDNNNLIEFQERKYSTWKFAIFGVFGLTFLAITACLFVVFISQYIATEVLNSKFAPMTICCALWCGLIMPLLVFLPLYTAAVIPQPSREACLALLFVFLGCGCLPFIRRAYQYCKYESASRREEDARREEQELAAQEQSRAAEKARHDNLPPTIALSNVSFHSPVGPGASSPGFAGPGAVASASASASAPGLSHSDSLQGEPGYTPGSTLVDMAALNAAAPVAVVAAPAALERPPSYNAPPGYED